MTGFPEIVVGTYEEFILGYTPQKSDEKGKLLLSQSFASHSHQASIRCVASHGKYLVSSGADEYINIYDLTAREVSTVINFHDSTVTCVEFVPDGSHLITANQNGDIAIFNTKDWSLAKHWKQAHKTANGVLSMSVHPSGGLLMSAGGDNILRFWNLIKGRQAYAVNVSKKCTVGNTLNFTKWSKTGKYYIICIGKQAEIYVTELASIVYTIDCSSKISSADFTASDVLVIGLDNGVVQIHSVKKKALLHEKQCHKTRVKCISAFRSQSLLNTENKINFIVTTDSEGKIKLWHMKVKKPVYSLIQKAETDIDCRITCLTTVMFDVKEESMDENEC